MGVTCVFPISVTEGKSSQQEFNSLIKNFEFLGGEKCGNWNIDCETYQSSADGNVKLIHLLHNSEHPQLSFSILENSTCLVSEIGFDAILLKLKSFYTPRKGGKMDIKGSKYRFGDFTVKLGNMTQASNFKGIVMETHYLPCSDPLQCWNLLGEFVVRIVGDKITLPNSPKAVVDQHLGLFSTADTMLQYLELILPTKKS